MKHKKKLEPWEVVIPDRFVSRKKPDNPYVTALLYFAIFFMSFMLIFVSFVSLCQVNKTSMTDTLFDGDYVLVLKGDKSLTRGEIVVITVAQYDNGNFSDAKENIIKRIVALPGDTFSLRTVAEEPDKVKLFRKGPSEVELKPIDEPYIKGGSMLAGEFRGTKFEPNKEYTVPEGMFLAFGDNRNSSVDSRNYGYFTFDAVYGTMFFRLEPNSWLENVMKFIY